MFALVDYAASSENLNYIDRSRIGATGHSAGGNAAIRGANYFGRQAQRTGHLTTRACGEIATRAGAQRLVPFHFSRRYEDDLAPCYDELRAAFARTITPPLRDDGS